MRLWLRLLTITVPVMHRSRQDYCAPQLGTDSEAEPSLRRRAAPRAAANRCRLLDWYAGIAIVSDTEAGRDPRKCCLCRPCGQGTIGERTGPRHAHRFKTPSKPMFPTWRWE